MEATERRRPLVSKIAILRTSIAGGLGGLVGSILSEVFLDQRSGPSPLREVLLHTAVWAALTSLAIGTALLVAENLVSLRGRWNRDLGWVPFLAGLSGGLTGFVAQMFYSMVGANPLTRGMAWAMMGAGFGVILGLADKSVQRALRGVLGGVVGGFAGGVAFDFVGALLNLGSGDSGIAARAVGLMFLGAAIGAMLQLSQEVFKTAWILGTTTGPYEGKRYVFAKPAITVGRSDRNDVYLYQESDLPPTLGAFELVDKRWSWTGSDVLVNGIPGARVSLKSGDRLQFGRTVFVFHTREALETEGAARRWVLHGDAMVLSLPRNARNVTLGRGIKCSLVVDDRSVAEHHATLVFEGDGLFLEAKASSADTAVNDQPLKPGQRRLLKRGDLLKLGSVELALIAE